MQAEVQQVVLKRLSYVDSLDSFDIQKEFSLTNEAMYAELVSLVALKYIKLENKKSITLVLTPEGQTYSEQGTPEARIYHLSSIEGTPKEKVEG